MFSKVAVSVANNSVLNTEASRSIKHMYYTPSWIISVLLCSLLENGFASCRSDSPMRCWDIANICQFPLQAMCSFSPLAYLQTLGVLLLFCLRYFCGPLFSKIQPQLFSSKYVISGDILENNRIAFLLRLSWDVLSQVSEHCHNLFSN